MTPVIFKTPTWLRAAGVCSVVLWYYIFVVVGKYSFDSVVNIAMFIPLAAWFTYMGLVQLMFLIRGNPATVEITDTTVVVRNGWTTKVFDRATLRLHKIRGLRPTLMLHDTKHRSLITLNLLAAKQFAQINELLWEENGVKA